MKSIYPRLYRRNHSFYIRVRVPKKLQFIIKKKEIIYSLRTNDYYKGLRKGRRHSYFIDNFFKKIERLKMKIVGNKVILNKKDIFVTQKAMLQELLDKSPTYDEISAKRFYALIDRKMLEDENKKNWFINYIEKRIKENAYSKDHTKEIKKIISKCKKGKKIDFQNLYAPLYRIWDYNYNMEKNRLDQKIIAEAEVIEKLHSKGITPAKNQIFGTSKYMLENKHLYEAFLMKKKFESTKEIEMLLESIKNDRLKERDIADVFIEKERETLENCLDYFFEEKRSRRKGESGIKKNRNRLNKMFGWISAKYVDEITSNDCIKIDRKVKELKTTKGKKEKLKDKTIIEYISPFKEFLTFCKRKRYITDDFNDVVILLKKSEIKETKIKPYKDEELKILFSSPLILKNRYSKNKFPLFWIPLISLYTGCRLNEICQLNINDIIVEDGVKCFNMTIETESLDFKKSLKTLYSNRLVPVHPILSKIGFLDLYEKIKKNRNYVNKWIKENQKQVKIKSDGKIIRTVDAFTNNNLFFTLPYTQSNHHMGTVSNNFSDIKLELFPNREDLNFHSLRHSFITELSRKGVDYTQNADLAGHKKQGATAGYIDNTVRAFKEAVDKVSYPAIEENIEMFLSNLEKEKDFFK